MTSIATLQKTIDFDDDTLTPEDLLSLNDDQLADKAEKVLARVQRQKLKEKLKNDNKHKSTISSIPSSDSIGGETGDIFGLEET